MPSHARALGSWVRVPLQAWMSVYECNVLVLSCVGSGFASGYFPVQGILATVHKIHNFIINSEWEQTRETNPS
jgi:hypothetical protein